MQRKQEHLEDPVISTSAFSTRLNYLYFCTQLSVSSFFFFLRPRNLLLCVEDVSAER